MIILLDNGHGRNTPGKCSPDKRLLEWHYTRLITSRLQKELSRRGFDARLLVTETHDVALSERCRRANSVCAEHGARNVLLVSVHCNAAGSDNCWHDARGWSVFVARNASSASHRLAGSLFDAAKACGFSTRQPMPGQKFWIQSLAMCRDTRCPAVLTENLFQDNRADVDILLSEEGQRRIVELHTDGIINYINSL